MCTQCRLKQSARVRAISRGFARFRAVSRGFARYRAVSRDFVRCLCIQKQQSTNMYTHVHVHARVIPRTRSRSDSTPWCEAQATSVDTATPDQNAATAGPQHCSATGHCPFTGQAIGTRSQARQSYATRPSSRESPAGGRDHGNTSAYVTEALDHATDVHWLPAHVLSQIQQVTRLTRHHQQ